MLDGDGDPDRSGGKVRFFFRCVLLRNERFRRHNTCDRRCPIALYDYARGGHLHLARDVYIVRWIRLGEILTIFR